MNQHRKDAPADTLEELESLGERLAQWVGANPAVVLGVAGAILLIAASIGGYRAYSHARVEKASAALAAVRGEFMTAMGGKPTDAEVPEPANAEAARSIRTDFAERYAMLARDWSGTPTAALALLEAGQLYEQLGNRERALELWTEAVAGAATGSPVVGVIQSRIGHLQEDAGDFAAASRAHEAAAAVPGYPLRIDALADAARTSADAGQTDRALDLYRQIESEAPEAQLAPHVEARLEEIAARAGGAAPDAKTPASPPAP
ncbi:MAG: hypothetical protein DCC71_21670 [Proteobacteria bacterium]|nr:MAG: hypothetical protein DCC71_21670 [Pseudomonadota bacterium]